MPYFHKDIGNRERTCSNGQFAEIFFFPTLLINAQACCKVLTPGLGTSASKINVRGCSMMKGTRKRFAFLSVALAYEILEVCTSFGPLE